MSETISMQPCPAAHLRGDRHHLPTPTWQLSQRAARFTPSAIRQMLAIAERAGNDESPVPERHPGETARAAGGHMPTCAARAPVSLAGGLPAPETFPVALLRDACEHVLRSAPAAALQYADSAGFGPLREWIAADLRRHGMHVQARQVLVTNGSQQGLDLAAKVLMQEGAAVAVERPSYLGALQAFAPFAPTLAELANDEAGTRADAFTQIARGGITPRLAYLVPTFRNPSGQVLDDARRDALVEDAARHGVALLEDDPYRDLWCDGPPPSPLAARWPEGTVYLGSFSKVLAPGLRLGYLVLPDALWDTFLLAKQAADLHTAGFTQRIAHAVLTDPRFAGHGEQLRTHYRGRRDAMATALRRHLPAGCDWVLPSGGMFFWLRLPPVQDAQALLARALREGVAFVPGLSFHARDPDARTLRLAYVTEPPAVVDAAIATLARLIRAEMH